MKLTLDDAQKIIDQLNYYDAVLQWDRSYDDIKKLITEIDLVGQVESASYRENAVDCDHTGAMYKQYQIDRLGINGHDIHFGVNRCSRCGYEDYWQVDI